MTLKRLTGAVATAGVLATFVLPVAAHAADFLKPGGIFIPGSALRVGVSGAAGHVGSIQARFAATGSPLFWGDATHLGAAAPPNLNDETAAMFALQTPTGVYSPAFPGYGGSPQAFTQTSAPVLTGTGTAGDPWTVTSIFDATGTLHITQTVTHVDGTTEFLGTWAIHSTDVAPVNLKAFEGADLYVNDNDNGVGALTGTIPNRIVHSVASDGTAAELIEQPSTPWSHYFTGSNGPFYNSVLFDNFAHYPDTADTSQQDSGEGSEWIFTLAAGATETVSVMWHFTQPAPPQAPDVANAPATLTTQNSAAPTFTAHAGDNQLVGYECSLDGAAYAACTSPDSHAGLADGAHSFSVRGLNSAGTAGPATTVSWTVDTTPPGAPSITTAPPSITNQPSGSIAFTGDAGATFECSLDGAAFVPCAGTFGLTDLADGEHSFSVKQVDAAGHAGTASATTSWTIDTTVPVAPTSLTAPVSPSSSTASIAFAGDPGMTYECSLDDGAWAVCTSPVGVSGLAAGQHTMQVRQVTPAGTPGAANSITWTVPPAAADAPAPAPPATPAACVSARSVRLHWTVAPRSRLGAFKVIVNGRTIATLAKNRRAFTVGLHGRPAQTVRVQIRAKTRAGARFGTTRVYTTCAKRRLPGKLDTLRIKRLR